MGTHQLCQSMHNRDSRRRIKRGLKIPLRKSWLKTSNLKKEIYSDMECTEGPKLNPKQTSPRHIIKMAKSERQGEDSKSHKRKTINYKGIPIRLSADFSTEESGKIYLISTREKFA